MTIPAATAKTTICSFCLRESQKVNKLIAGPGVYICDGCVQRCNDLLAKEGSATGTATLPWKDTLNEEDLLRHLARIATTSGQADSSLRACVDQLRSRGLTWSRIGSVLGMTRQSAWERFSGED